jgi:hypothetical protein
MIASITLPRPSRKGDLANVVAPIPVKKLGQWLPKKEEEKEKKNEGEY